MRRVSSELLTARVQREEHELYIEDVVCSERQDAYSDGVQYDRYTTECVNTNEEFFYV